MPGGFALAFPTKATGFPHGFGMAKVREVTIGTPSQPKRTAAGAAIDTNVTAKDTRTINAEEV